jgi:hypothetical protein
VDGEVRHLVGLLLGTEDDWPRAFEYLLTGLSSLGGGLVMAGRTTAPES